MAIAQRIIKNTIFLYIKMGITVFISLYSTRLILSSLGAIDFGIFNIVGGAIAMLGFLNSTLANATQRFISYSQGEKDITKQHQVFNVSIILHIIVAIITSLLLVAIVQPLFNSILNIPSERIFASKIVYFGLIISTALTILNAPYDAVINAHEDMLYYSIIGILESLLRLSIAFICIYTPHDKLIVFGLCSACIPFITLTIMKIYCHTHYAECKISFRNYFDKKLLKEISLFSGWNFMTAISSLFSIQGVNILLNHFWGASLNAAQGIATQLNGQLSAFSNNMMKALNPIITKSVGAGNINLSSTASLKGSKFSTLLIIFFAVPCFIEMPYILHIWLKTPPDWAITFCRLILIQTTILKMADSFSTAIYAVGDIKNYAIYKSISNLLPILFTYIAFSLNGSPVWLYVSLILFWAIGGNIIIIHYAHKKIGLILRQYIQEVILPILIVSVLMLSFGYCTQFMLHSSFLRLCVSCTITSAVFIFTVWLFALSKLERNTIKENIKFLTKNC